MAGSCSLQAARRCGLNRRDGLPPVSRPAGTGTARSMRTATPVASTGCPPARRRRSRRGCRRRSSELGSDRRIGAHLPDQPDAQGVAGGVVEADRHRAEPGRAAVDGLRSPAAYGALAVADPQRALAGEAEGGERACRSRQRPEAETRLSSGRPRWRGRTATRGTGDRHASGSQRAEEVSGNRKPHDGPSFRAVARSTTTTRAPRVTKRTSAPPSEPHARDAGADPTAWCGDVHGVVVGVETNDASVAGHVGLARGATVMSSRPASPRHDHRLCR